MTTVMMPRLALELKPIHEIKVDLDDRAFLFPSGKSLNQLAFLSDGRMIFVEGSFQFNQARTPPRFLTLTYEDGKELTHKLIEAVYYAKPQLVITSGVKITITVAANGYHLQVGDLNQAIELFLSTGCIWRVCQALLRIVDLISPVESN